MDLNFDFDEHQGITSVQFHGLDGSERVSSVKDALVMMKIRNPAVTFSEAVHNNKYDDVPDAEYMRMLTTVKYLSSLWYYPGESSEAKPKYEMSALMLLANTLEALSQFNTLYQMPYDAEPQDP